MANDPLVDAEKYLFPDRLTDADKEDAPRVIRALAGKLAAYRIFGPDVITETHILQCIVDAGFIAEAGVAHAIMDKFKVVKK